MTVDGNVTTNVTKLQGQEVELLCIIEYSHELETKFSWIVETLSGVTPVGNKTFQTNLTRSAIGNYTCKTSDLFGNYSTTISVDVLCKLINNFNVVQAALCFSRFIKKRGIVLLASYKAGA